MKFNLEELTFDDLEEVAAIAGDAAVEQLMGGKVVPRAMKAVIYCLGRRENPDFTLEDAGKVKLSELEVVEADPTGNAG